MLKFTDSSRRAAILITINPKVPKNAKSPPKNALNSKSQTTVLQKTNRILSNRFSTMAQ